MNRASLGRRQILYKLAGGGAVSCTFLGNQDCVWGQTVMPDAAQRPSPLVVLDPGHGGRDQGATGATGTLEKDVTLASGLALKTELETSGRYRVELTRATDHFVTRKDRITMARDLGASLFLSMHADQ